jgi:hypothetical protein
MKKNVKRFATSMCALAMLSVPTTINEVAPIFSADPPAIVCMIDANAASVKKRSGKKDTYISKIGWKKCALTICVNTDKDINSLLDFLNAAGKYTSGAKHSAKICQLASKANILDIKSKIILKFATSLFKGCDGFGKSAKKAYKKVKSTASKYKKKGIKLTIRENGDWIVETQ